MNDDAKYFDPVGQGTPTRVLLLDDNLMTSLGLRQQLQTLGCEVVVASTVPDQSTLGPHLVIINLGSRTMNGLGLIAAAQSTLNGATVVGFCGHKEIEIRRAAKAAGVDRLLTNENAAEEAGKWLYEHGTQK